MSASAAARRKLLAGALGSGFPSPVALGRVRCMPVWFDSLYRCAVRNAGVCLGCGSGCLGLLVLVVTLTAKVQSLNNMPKVSVSRRLAESCLS